MTLGTLAVVFIYYGEYDEPLINSEKSSDETISSNEDFSANDHMKEFNMIAKQWTYEPREIVVNVGDQVVLNIKSTDVTHSFTLPEFGLDEFGDSGINSVLKPNNEVQIKFTADRAGEFVFGCDIVCGKGHSNMLGKIIVQ